MSYISFHIIFTGLIFLIAQNWCSKGRLYSLSITISIIIFFIFRMIVNFKFLCILGLTFCSWTNYWVPYLMKSAYKCANNVEWICNLSYFQWTLVVFLINIILQFPTILKLKNCTFSIGKTHAFLFNFITMFRIDIFISVYPVISFFIDNHTV